MANNTSFAIELQGIDIPVEAKSRIDEALQQAVMTELAKLDLAKGATVEPLSAERNLGLVARAGGVAGFVLRTMGDRSDIPKNHVPISIMPAFVPEVPLPLRDMGAFQAVCLRPDIRQAIISNSQALMELLSNDEQASKNFNSLIGQMNPGQPSEERLAPLIIVGIAAGCAALGGFVGWASRPS